MQIETFDLERNQTLYENSVELNLTESGVHPCTIRELLEQPAIAALLDTPIGYGYTEGRPALRAAIAKWYPGASPENVAVTHGASEANLLSVLTLLSPGDEVVFVVPNFMQIRGLARALGVGVRCCVLQEESDWQPQRDVLESLIRPAHAHDRAGQSQQSDRPGAHRRQHGDAGGCGAVAWLVAGVG